MFGQVTVAYVDLVLFELYIYMANGTVLPFKFDFWHDSIMDTSIVVGMGNQVIYNFRCESNS